MSEQTLGGGGRRSEVLDVALRVFSRYGYRKTSMEDIAQEAGISRPGLYFLFASKSGLFRAAAERGVELDLSAAAQALAASGRRLDERIVEAFDCWAGRYVGPMQDTAALIESTPGILGPMALDAPSRFEALLSAALEREMCFAEPLVVVRTLISISIGLKHQTTTREEYRARLADGVRLLTAGVPRAPEPCP